MGISEKMIQNIMISGHRGTRVHAIENTPAAFDFCIDNNLEYIEFDVKRTKDYKIVVFHDAKIDKLLNGTGKVKDFTYEELKQFEYKDGQKIQTLAEFFEQIGGKGKNKKIRPMLEIKSRNIAPHVMQIVHEYNFEGDEILIQSFVASDIKACWKIDPQYDYGLCISAGGIVSFLKKFTSKIYYILNVKRFPFVKWLNIDGPLVHDEFMNEMTLHGLRIILGASNTWNYLKKIDKWRIEIINCDDALQIKRLLKKLKDGML